MCAALLTETIRKTYLKQNKQNLKKIEKIKIFKKNWQG